MIFERASTSNLILIFTSQRGSLSMLSSAPDLFLKINYQLIILLYINNL